MDFENWRSSKRYADDVELPDEIRLPAHIYSDGAWIQVVEGEPCYTLVGTAEFESDSLEEVEKWLWENHSRFNQEK